MNYNCPTPNCSSSLKNRLVVKDGFYFRGDDSRHIQRFVCKVCRRKFSRATFSLEKNQKKRRVNYELFSLLCSNVSMRRAAIHLKINYKTVQRKFEYLSRKSKIKQQKFLIEMKKTKVMSLQFDDLITLEHTKMKPLSVTIAVDKNRRTILAAEVSRIPAFGLLAEKSRRKYGKRKSEHEKGLKRVFEKLKDVVDKNAVIESDEHKAYAKYVACYFSRAVYKQYKGGRGCIAGQGELKKLHFDPLFILNHTCAMLRSDINRLIRRTWCTTKRVDMLQKHIDMYIHYYNFEKLKLKSSPS